MARLAEDRRSVLEAPSRSGCPTNRCSGPAFGRPLIGKASGGHRKAWRGTAFAPDDSRRVLGALQAGLEPEVAYLGLLARARPRRGVDAERYPAALEALQPALAGDDTGFFRYHHGVCLLKMGRRGEARRVLEALNLDGLIAAYSLDLPDVVATLEALGRFDRAIEVEDQLTLRRMRSGAASPVVIVRPAREVPGSSVLQLTPMEAGTQVR